MILCLLCPQFQNCNVGADVKDDIEKCRVLNECIIKQKELGMLQQKNTKINGKKRYGDKNDRNKFSKFRK